MPSLPNLPPEALLRDQVYGIFSDFTDNFVTGDAFTDLSADSGAAVTNRDQAGGVIRLSSIAIDNNEVNLYSKEAFLFAANKPITAVCRMAFAQGNTDDINVAFGFIDAVAADAIVNNGGGPKTTASGVAFECRDGETEWRVWKSISTTQTSTLLSAANSYTKAAVTSASGASTFQNLRIEVNPYSSTNQKVDYFVNDVLVYSYDMVYTNATEMSLWVGLKLGGATVENVDVDYLGAWQKR